MRPLKKTIEDAGDRPEQLREGCGGQLQCVIPTASRLNTACLAR